MKGTERASEPETKAVVKTFKDINSNDNIRVYVTFHSYGKKAGFYILYKYTGCLLNLVVFLFENEIMPDRPTNQLTDIRHEGS